ncbi:molybdopterin-dependent oxidoreductase [archaeon]|nr:molybdopterin-dependent oxidoreductase [archaeon]
MKKTLLISLTLLLITGCVTRGAVELEEAEVTGYQGEDLSSINAFRENSIRGPQYVNISEYELEVNGLVNNPMNYSYNEVLAHQSYKKVVTLYCVEGWSVKILWEGVLLEDLFNEVEVLPEADTVIFHAYDGYSTSLSLDYLLSNDIILAYKINNVTLPPANGYPFQLVAEDKWGYKWIRWVTRIELSADSDYQGFWEQRGFNQNGSVSGPKLEQ